MNSVRHTALLKIVLVAAVLAVLYALFAPSARASAWTGQETAAARPACAPDERDGGQPVRSFDGA